LKKRAASVIVLSIIFLAILAFAQGSEEEKSVNPDPYSLPSSLDSFYPPAAQGPVYLFTMLEFTPSFSGIMSDLMEGEPQNVQANYDSFREKYLAASELVPEWKEDFGLAAVDELGSAIKTGDQSKIAPAFEKVGKACVDCHVKNSTSVQHKYHWGDYSTITATDPVSSQDVSFFQFMFMIESDFSGIGIDLSQGQVENALRHLDGFERRYQTLAETCDACHDSERKYYVDESITGMIGALKLKLQEETPDQKSVGELLQGIGYESCYKCHLIHTPSAYAKARAR
jgi:hypothetical protein